MILTGAVILLLALCAIVAIAWIIRIAIYLLIGAGYVLFAAGVALYCLARVIGWTAWRFALVTRWAYRKVAPAISRTYLRAMDAREARRAAAADELWNADRLAISPVDAVEAESALAQIERDAAEL